MSEFASSSSPVIFDLTYVTVDSLSEGVGSSQIIPLVQRLSRAGLAVNLISFEKRHPSQEIEAMLKEFGVTWDQREFKVHGSLGGLSRLLEISRRIPASKIVHARSDIPAVAASLSRRAPILWDVRSLWADQKAFNETNPIRKRIIQSYGLLEGIASFSATAMSTLTHAVVPVLEKRHRRVPHLRTVVPTAVDLHRFKFSPVIRLPLKGLYSGTYNSYYDLPLSSDFLGALREISDVEVHWARPRESHKSSLNAGESFTFESTQQEMANIISDYAFGISICNMNAGDSMKAAMPTKVAEFLACGRPVVINQGLGDFDEYVREFNTGVVLDGTQEDLILKAEELMDLIADPDTPRRCRALAEKYFDIEKGAEKYLDLYSKM